MRAFIIVLDSLGCGYAPDAAAFGDQGNNTLKALYDSGHLHVPTLKKMGLFNIEGNRYDENAPVDKPIADFCRLTEKSAAKDTTVGHWELAGLVSNKPFPTYPNGFPQSVIEEFEQKSGYKTILNKPYSGTQAIEEYGEEHIKTGKLIVYTSADSVFQIAAHEQVVSVEELYRVCRIAREILRGEHGVGRVIARPFVGEYPNFVRTANRHDFSLEPPEDTMLDVLKRKGFDVISVGKIVDIFAGKGITKAIRTLSNDDGMAKTLQISNEDFNGLCFVNLVDFDAKYGHRNDVDGYVKALNDFDVQLDELLKNIRHGDILILTADHGCDPSTPSTDHSRERVPMLAYSPDLPMGVDYGTLEFGAVAGTVLDCLKVEHDLPVKSIFANEKI